MAIKQQLQHLVSLYRKGGIKNATGLLRPASIREIDRAFADIKAAPSQQLREVWNVYGGQPYFDAGTEGLFGSYRLLSPKESVEEYECIESNWYSIWDEPPNYPPEEGEDGGWVPGLVPFANWDQYTLLVDPESEVVWGFYNHGFNCRFESIESLLDKLIDCYPFDEPTDPTFGDWAMEMKDSASCLQPKKA